MQRWEAVCGSAALMALSRSLNLAAHLCGGRYSSLHIQWVSHVPVPKDASFSSPRSTIWLWIPCMRVQPVCNSSCHSQASRTRVTLCAGGRRQAHSVAVVGMAQCGSRVYTLALDGSLRGWASDLRFDEDCRCAHGLLLFVHGLVSFWVCSRPQLPLLVVRPSAARVLQPQDAAASEPMILHSA